MMTKIVAMSRLLLATVATRGRLIAIGLLGVLGVGMALILRLATDDIDPQDYEGFLGSFGVGIVMTVVALVVASATLGTLVEQKTLVYFWLRPQASWRIAVAAFCAGVLVVAPVVTATLVGIAALLGDGGGDIARAATAGILGSIGYVGMFTLLGLLTQRALPWGLVYILVWEGLISGFSDGARRYSLRNWVTSLARRENLGIEVDIERYGTTSSILVLLIVAVVGTLGASLSLRSREIA